MGVFNISLLLKIFITAGQSFNHAHPVNFVSFLVSFSFGKSLFGMEKAHKKLTAKIQ